MIHYDLVAVFCIVADFGGEKWTCPDLKSETWYTHFQSLVDDVFVNGRYEIISMWPKYEIPGKSAYNLLVKWESD